MDTTLNKLAFLDEVICYYIQVVKEYSAFLGDSLLNNWVKYREFKRKNSLNSINNSLSKLAEIEKKKEIIINRYEYNDKVSLAFYNNLYKEISNSLSSGLFYMIKYYDKIRNKEDSIKNNKTSDDNIKIRYILLDDGYYAHLRYEKKKLVINKTSFKNETIIFKSSLKEKHMKWDNNLSLSSFEKRREKIVDKSFNVCKKISDLKNKKVSASYKLDDVYEICKVIIDDLYDDLVSKEGESDAFKKLMKLTKEQYGSFNYLTDYDLLFMNFNKNKIQLGKSFIEELINKSSQLKKTSEFIEFKDVDEIIPSVFDLYNILNNRIINNVNLSIRDLKGRINVVTSYMTIDEMISYYNRLIEINKDIKYSISCQKHFVKMIEERFNIPEDIIIADYMKQDKIYK